LLAGLFSAQGGDIVGAADIAFVVGLAVAISPIDPSVGSAVCAVAATGFGASVGIAAGIASVVAGIASVVAGIASIRTAFVLTARSGAAKVGFVAGSKTEDGQRYDEMAWDEMLHTYLSANLVNSLGK